jgi:hypothetical protein
VVLDIRRDRHALAGQMLRPRLDEFGRMSTAATPSRKPWMVKFNRMAIFEAAEFGIASFPRTYGGEK